jgi:hypothetical protein
MGAVEKRGEYVASLVSMAQVQEAQRFRDLKRPTLTAAPRGTEARDDA